MKTRIVRMQIIAICSMNRPVEPTVENIARIVRSAGITDTINVDRAKIQAGYVLVSFRMPHMHPIIASLWEVPNVTCVKSLNGSG